MVHTAIVFHTSNTVQAGVEIVFFPFGFVVDIEPGITYYHAGDTALFSDMKLIRDLYKPNVMAVGISRILPELSCEMAPREAAYATAWVGCDVVIPTHYGLGSPDLDLYIKYATVIAPKSQIISGVNKSFLYTPLQAEEIQSMGQTYHT